MCALFVSNSRKYGRTLPELRVAVFRAGVLLSFAAVLPRYLTLYRWLAAVDVDSVRARSLSRCLADIGVLRAIVGDRRVLRGWSCCQNLLVTSKASYVLPFDLAWAVYIPVFCGVLIGWSFSL